MNKYLARSWEYVFSSHLPRSMDTLAQALGRELQAFRLQMGQRAQLAKAPSFTLATRQVENLERSLKDTTGLKVKLGTDQKRASRVLVRVVGKRMTKGYMSCVEERGETDLHSRHAYQHL